MGGMTEDQIVTIHAVPHPSPQIQRIGVPLDHPYLEECWAPVLGPSSILLLRRVAALWRESDRIESTLADLGQGIGLGKGSGRNSPVQRTMDRLERFGFLRQSATGENVAVAATAGPLSERQLERVPEWNRVRHGVLWGRHLDGLAAAEPTVPSIGLPDQRAITSHPPALVPSTAVPVR